MSDKKIVLPTNDLAFKKLFASSENSDILIGFINDFYGLKVKEVLIENPYNIEDFNKILTESESLGYFETEVDTICTTEDNKKFTIEMQIKNMGYYIERSLFYSFNVYLASYNNTKLLRDSKVKYSSLYPVYSINILNYNQFKDKKSIHKFSLYDLENEMHLKNVDGENILSIGFLELRKKDKTLSKNMKYWIEFFKTGKVPKEAPEYIRKADNLISVNQFSKEEMQMLNRIERIKEDAKARDLFVREEGKREGKREGKVEGIKEGEEKGIKKGLKEKSIKVAMSLIKDNIPIEKIEEYTDLSRSEIEELMALDK